MKVKIEEVLAESGFADQRAAKMDVDDLLKCVDLTLSSCGILMTQTFGDLQLARNVGV